MWRDRLASINQELLAMDATDEFCREYLLVGGGSCERVAGKRCIKHRGCRGPLPKGKMCALEFGQRVVELRKQVGRFSKFFPCAADVSLYSQASDVELERGKLRREWDRLRSLEKCLDPWSQVPTSVFLCLACPRC